MNRDRYRTHDVRIRGSLERHVGEAPADDADLRAMAAKAWERGVILFLRADLQGLPWASREIIEAEAARLYGKPGK